MSILNCLHPVCYKSHLLKSHYISQICRFMARAGGIWFIGYGCREQREICLITNQRAKATQALKWPAISGFHSQTVIHRRSMNDSLSSFVRPSDCFQAARSSTKAKCWCFCYGALYCQFCERYRLLRVMEIKCCRVKPVCVTSRLETTHPYPKTYY